MSREGSFHGGFMCFLKHNNKWAPSPPLSTLPTEHISLTVNGGDFPCGGRSSLARISPRPGAGETVIADDECAQRGVILPPSPPACSPPLPALPCLRGHRLNASPGDAWPCSATEVRLLQLSPGVSGPALSSTWGHKHQVGVSRPSLPNHCGLVLRSLPWVRPEAAQLRWVATSFHPRQGEYRDHTCVPSPGVAVLSTLFSPEAEAALRSGLAIDLLCDIG